MGVQERRARAREELRETILDAARELFAAEGYEAVSMRRIAEKIEYSPTAIYLHFADKETLFRQVCERDFLALAVRFRELARIEDPIERLRRTGHAYCEFALEHPNPYRLMFMTPHPPVDHSRHELVHRGNPEEDAYAFLKSILADAHARGRLRPEFGDLELAAQVIWAGVHGIVSLRIAKGGDDWIEWKDARHAVHHMIETILRGVVAEPPTPQRAA